MAAESNAYDLKAHIRSIPDFPKPGILFRDITPLLGSAEAFKHAIEAMPPAPEGCRKCHYLYDI